MRQIKLTIIITAILLVGILSAQNKKDTKNTKNDFTQMVFVKGGTFQMGGNGSDEEKPIHTVTVGDFYIGKYEVTQKEWKAIIGNNPSGFKGVSRPVENVSWNDVQDFIKKVNVKTGIKYRLPTEAEWEYAAKGGNMSKGYECSGSNSDDEVAWTFSNSNDETHPVGKKRANELGIHDMSGNVWEWCQDLFGSYQNQSQTNPTGASNGENRVIRGGSYYKNDISGCTSSFRDSGTPDYKIGFIGFRLVRE